VLAAGLKVGSVVDETKLLSVAFDSDVDAAFNKCIDLLARSLKTERQIVTYLTGKGYSDEVTAVVVGKLKGYHYIDDVKYAQLYTAQNSTSKGARRIKLELGAKGIDRQLSDAAADSIDAEKSADTARQLAEKYMKNKNTDVKMLVKLQRYLLTRGFEYEVISSIVNGYRNSDED
jgi:regulatory protein